MFLPTPLVTRPPLVTRSRLVTRSLLLTVIVGTTTLGTAPVGSQAQVIALKTVPLATGDQFLLLPSERLGMGGGVHRTR